MQKDYKRLGNYIRQKNVRNRDLETETLLGVSITKKLIPSIANVIGTDMSTYKVIEKGQFAYGTVTSRNGDKISIALSDEYEKALVSQIYIVFEVIDTEELLPGYLMMWFSRPEFDRYARYHSHGSTRETFDWADMCEVKLPIPSIKEQRQIVAQYESVANKIKVNEEICEKLEAAAQALYKRWFADFEFPTGHCEERDTNEEAIPALVAEERSLYTSKQKGYKSSGGKMVWNEELGKEIPEGWQLGILKDIFKNFDSKRKPITASDRVKEKGLYPYYGAAALMDYIDDYIFDGTYILLGEDGTVINKDGSPVLQYVWGKFWVNNHAHVLKGKNGYDENSLYLFLKNTNVADIITGGVQLKINQGNLNNLSIVKPSKAVILAFNHQIYYMFELIKSFEDQNQKLIQVQSLLLSRLAVREELVI